MAAIDAYILIAVIFGIFLVMLMCLCSAKRRRSKVDPGAEGIDNINMSVPSVLEISSQEVAGYVPDPLPMVSVPSIPASASLVSEARTENDFRSVPMVVRMGEVLQVDSLAGRFDHIIPIPRMPPYIYDEAPPVANSEVERFLSDMGREKPIRFTTTQLQDYTLNYAWQLGSGGFGVVYKGELPNGILIAVKILNNSAGEGVREQFMAEVGTIGRTYHKNLVRLYGFCFDIKVKALVYEYMDNGSLDTVLFNKNHSIEWEKLYEIAIGTAKGLAYLHEGCQKRIIHYDIKPGNILLDMNFSPKVADFGLAKLCNRDSTHITMTGARGTPGYAAPELWLPFAVTCKCDVYSYGMMLFEIVGRRRNLNLSLPESEQWLPKQVWEKFKNAELDELMVECGIEEKDKDKAKTMLMVALWCAQYSSEARPTMSNVAKLLEQGGQVMAPPNPFQHLAPSSDVALTMFTEADSGDESIS